MSFLFGRPRSSCSSDPVPKSPGPDGPLSFLIGRARSTSCSGCDSPVPKSPGPVVFVCSSGCPGSRDICARVDAFAVGKFATHALCVDNRADQIYEVPIERVAKDLKALFPDYTLAEGDVAVLYLEKEGNESVTFMRKLGGHFAFSS